MAENSNTNTGKGGFLSSSTMDYEKAGIASRSLTNWMLTHATVEAWTQFFHQPYKCDIGEAKEKAIERYEFETGEKWINSQKMWIYSCKAFATKRKK